MRSLGRPAAGRRKERPMEGRVGTTRQPPPVQTRLDLRQGNLESDFPLPFPTLGKPAFAAQGKQPADRQYPTLGQTANPDAEGDAAPRADVPRAVEHAFHGGAGGAVAFQPDSRLLRPQTAIRYQVVISWKTAVEHCVDAIASKPTTVTGLQLAVVRRRAGYLWKAYFITEVASDRSTGTEEGVRLPARPLEDAKDMTGHAVQRLAAPKQKRAIQGNCPEVFGAIAEDIADLTRPSPVPAPAVAERQSGPERSGNRGGMRREQASDVLLRRVAHREGGSAPEEPRIHRLQFKANHDPDPVRRGRPENGQATAHRCPPARWGPFRCRLP